ncbi:MAG: M56 family metallopeptidase, partial [Planctomycetales bacterium]|nr:M56 family metallopeptidase [Planctomycetales bacterium]
MMSEAIDFVIVENLGWTLFHSLWQFTLIGIAVWLFLTALQCRSSAIRYRVLSCGLLSMITVSCITFFTLANETARNIRSAELVSVSTDVGLPAPHPHEIDDNAVSTFQSPIVSEPFVARPDPRRSGYRISGEQRSVTGSGISHEPAALSWAHWRGVVLAVVEPWIPMIMFVWMAGVAVLSLRPLVGWRSAGRLRSVGLSEAPQRVVEIVGRLARQMRITKALTVVESALVEIPTVVGWLRPVILMPASAITGLPNEQLEAVIAHELAHIRRHDYLVNAVQVFLETVFFYHPALWWVSMSMRDEREKCCDAVVVGMTGDPAEYVKMLLRVEESRGMSAVPHPALSAGGGRLVDRIRLLTHPPVRRGSNGGFYSVLLLAVSV